MTLDSTQIEQLTTIARKAGDIIMDVYNSDDFDVEQKDDGDFVSPLTRADKLAGEYIVTELSKISDLPIVSEENSVRSSDGPYWLVDPLDGTKEFVKRGGDFTVNIALIEDHAPVFGVVYAPVLKRTYVGDVVQGLAYREDGSGREEIEAISTASPPVVVASKSHRNTETEQLLSMIGPHEDRSFGSSLKLCVVAEGEAMLYPRLGPTSLWDTAAADAVVRAAGGMVYSVDGKPLVYDIDAGTLNPYFVVEAANSTIDWQSCLS